MYDPQTEVILLHANTELARVTLPPGEYVIGRDPSASVYADTPILSRRHALLTIRPDSLFIEDLRSSNGTFVNEQPLVGTMPVSPGQPVRLGDVTLMVCREILAPPMSTATAIERLVPSEILASKRYAIGAQVARGGMGAILEAQQAAMKRRVAMKVMLDGAEPADVARFVDEAQITGQLDHPNIVPVHDLGVDEQGQLFYTMKFVRGTTLKKVLELLANRDAESMKQYPLPTLLTIFQKACDAVAFAHSKQVIHRDLKPENIMLGDFGSVLVMDWGLAKVLTEQRTATLARPALYDAPRSIVASARAEQTFGGTIAGTIMGTPQYMAPEQARGEIDTMDHRADIYALGAILFHLLHLRPTVTGTRSFEIIEKVQRGDIDWTPPKKPVPDSLLAVCRKALALDPVTRYGSVAELQADIAAYQGGFATKAEQAGLGKQLVLLIKRNKIASLGIAVLLLVSLGFTAKVITEGQRAEREAGRANHALADLRKTAPALRSLAENEASAQRFDSALEKLDAALALDPADTISYWQRAWIFLGLERWSDAIAALQVAQRHDPANARLAHIVPAVERLAATPESQRWKSDAAREVFHHLREAKANGPMLAFTSKLVLGASERQKIAEQRLNELVGSENCGVGVEADGLVWAWVYRGMARSFAVFQGLPVDSVNAGSAPIADLDALRGMPLKRLVLTATRVADLTPLRGMHLQKLEISYTPVHDLSPLAGMPLTSLQIGQTKVVDLSPLAGMPLTELVANWLPLSRIEALRGLPLIKVVLDNTAVADGSPLVGAPIETLDVSSTRISDLSFLKGMPLRTLNLAYTPVTDLSTLRGLPLEWLRLQDTRVSDLEPLRDAPLKQLDLRRCRSVTDFTPILSLTKLECLFLDVLPSSLLFLRESKTLHSIDADAFPGENHKGLRTVAQFWADYEAWQVAGKK